MTNSVRWRPEAEADLVDAFRWYENRREGLGGEFLLSIDAAITELRKYPESGPLVADPLRRSLVRRFPYGVFYIVEREQIVILGIFHASRSPRAWKDRMQP